MKVFFFFLCCFYVPDIFFFRLITAPKKHTLCPTTVPTPSPLLRAPARRVDSEVMTNSRKRHQGGAGRSVKWGTRKVCTRSLNTRHITLTTQPQGTTVTTDGAKAPAPCPPAAARGSWVHTATTIHTHHCEHSLAGWIGC
jgi:hypothetical protein